MARIEQGDVVTVKGHDEMTTVQDILGKTVLLTDKVGGTDTYHIDEVEVVME